MTMMGTLHHACDHMNLVVINRTSTLEVLGYLVLWPHELYVPKRTLGHVILHRNINTCRVQVMYLQSMELRIFDCYVRIKE
jgi:hypothetical protein